MPSTPFLDDAGTDPEVRRVVGVAFELTRIPLSLPERPAITNEIIAKRIIELAKAGERHRDIMSEGVLKEFPERALYSRTAGGRPLTPESERRDSCSGSRLAGPR